MTDLSPIAATTARAPRNRGFSTIRRFVVQQPVGALSFTVILVMLLAGIFADQIAPYDPRANDYMALLAPPSWEHLAGTDSFGRDLFSRIIHGARTAMVIGLSSALMGCVIGALLGTTSAYFGGRVDAVIQRFVDILLAFPLVVLALVVVAVLGRRPVAGIDMSLIFAIAIPMIPQVSRVIRAAALSVRVMPYIDAARTAGFSHGRIIVQHMIPNLLTPFIIMLTAYVAQAILLESTLSFLGLGVSEPTPAWGLMLSGNAQDYFESAPWLIVFPGLAISLAVISFNLFGDALRDFLDPRLNR